MPPRQRNEHWKAYVALIIGLLILSSSAILTRWADAPGSVVSLYRMSIATLILAVPFFSARAKNKKPLDRRGVWLALLAGLFFGADLAAWASGIALAGATIPTLLGNTAPLWVGLGAWLIFKEHLGVRFWLGLALAMSGAVAMLGIDFSSGFEINTGALLGMIGAVFYGSYMLVTQKSRDVLDTLSFFWIAAVGSTITLIILCLIQGVPLTGYSRFSYLNFIGLGVAVQAGAWMLINYAQGYLPASLVSPTLLSQPLLTAIIAGPLLNEWLTPFEWVAGAAVLLGIVIVHRSRTARRVLPQPAV
jgi:drug/metabolite transporter (DMT)-like permease